MGFVTAVTDEYDSGVVEADFSSLEEEEPDGPDPDNRVVPPGMTLDRETGEIRPKKRPGRPRKPPGEEELRARGPVGDRPPDKPPRADAKPPDPVPDMPRAGTISRGVNRLYRRAGKIVRGMEHGQRDGIGQAIIESTRADEETEWPTVGEAWENLARTNPRIRAFLLRAIAGEGWIELAMAHGPIAMAVIMKPAIRSRIPVIDIVRSWTEHDDDDDDEDGGFPDLENLTEDDMRLMAEQAGMDMEQMAAMAARMSAKLPPEVAAAAERAAQRNPSGLTPQFTSPPEGSDRLPPAYRRQQPKRSTKAQRAGR